MKESSLYGAPLVVLNKLENMKDGERIVGRDLMAIANIKDPRSLFSIIEELRDSGHHIGASKSLYDPGYYQMRSDTEIMDYYFTRDREVQRESDRLRRNAERYFKEKYGENFDFIEYRAREELKRFGKSGTDN